MTSLDPASLRSTKERTTGPSPEPLGPAQPFLKWAGGKAAIAPKIVKLLPPDVRTRPYREPFLGGGAMFFYLRPSRAFLSDAVFDLVSTYETVRSSVDALVLELVALRDAHSEEQFYRIRDRFNEEPEASALSRAAWFIYLNKTCYNGLFRTNQKGIFNVPMGRYKNPNIADHRVLRAAAHALSNASLKKQGFEHLLDTCQPGDFIYMDPPYDAVSKTANFNGYADGRFSSEQQEHLSFVFRELDKRGCLLALSNSDTPLIRRLYRGFSLTRIEAPRHISSKGSTRKPIFELLVRNAKSWPRGR